MSKQARRPQRSHQSRSRVPLRRALLVAVVAAVVVTTALVVRPDTVGTAAGPSDADGAAGQTQEQVPLDTAADADESLAAPDVDFEHFDGGAAQLADWRGEPLVVNFWASWCPPCVAEMRDAFEPLHAELGEQVTFLGVNLQDNEDDAVDVIAQTGVTYDLARDDDGTLFTAFGGFGMPLTALIDEDGTVVARHTGALSQAELEALVREHLLEA